MSVHMSDEDRITITRTAKHLTVAAAILVICLIGGLFLYLCNDVVQELIRGFLRLARP